MHRPRPFLALAAAIFCVAATACGGGPDRPRSALLITLDTTRHDALTVFGGPPGASPRLDALAAEGVVYDQARTVAPLTMPSHASILTGLIPPRHTVHTNSELSLPRDATTLAERAQERGFQTGAFIAAVVLADDFGLDQGFDVYDQPVPPLVQATRHYDRRRASEVADAAIDWIDGLDPEKPFFGWAHFFDPHLPFTPEPRFVEQVGSSGYHAEVAAMDHAIGRILDALDERGLYDNTMVIVVADHGESMGEHGEETHGTLAYDAVIKVPMIVRDPDGHRAGERSDEITSVVDVFPTFVEALELGAASDVDGISLYRRTVPEDRGVYFESYYGFFSFQWSPIVGFADRNGKYVHSSTPEFFGIADERDLNDTLASLPAETVEGYRDRIRELVGRPALTRSESDEAGASVIERLIKMGYTGASGDGADVDPLEVLDLPNPKAMQGNYKMLLAAQELSGAQRWEESITLLERVLDKNPKNPVAWFQLGGALIATERFEESIEASLKNLEFGSSWYGPHKNLGIAYYNLDRKEEALAAFDEALKTGPYLMDVLNQCITICEELDRDDDANRYRMKLIEAREEQAIRGQ